MKLVLHNYWRSSASYRVRIALALKGLAYDYKAVPILEGAQRAEDYRGLNPMAQVPTLVVDDGDAPGDARIALTQSLPIIEYLDERWPAPALLPADPYLRARTRALAETINSGIQPLQNLPVMAKVKQLGGDDVAWVREFVRTGLVALECLGRDLGGRFCVGDTPTVADCCLVPQLYSARRFHVPLDGLDRLIRIDEACAALPAFAAAHPDRQPDAVPPRS